MVTKASKASWASSNASAFADRAFFSAEEQASTFERCDKNVHGKIVMEKLSFDIKVRIR